ncbi:DUF4232 domain-containing protein [Corynebacterium glutamicum]|uniref:DUF4232 domain-containing protein n=1 Tax=Corynebacterium glutamicum TaxID=1718 RepID=UPI000744B911|nr:DUF4232 domain-containing protein [Corynebacterium glutamicum]AMA00521.1 hypothetical protein APT58_09900 [Corynebacterium glutamicum]
MKPHTLLRQALAIGSVGGLLVLSACGNSDSTSPTVSETVTEIVTETSAPDSTAAPIESSPATSSDAMPSEVVPSEVMPKQCTTSELNISTGTQQGAAGSVLIDLNFTNAGSTDCTLHGFPGVSFVGMDNGTQIGAPAVREGDAFPAVTLGPGENTIAALKISRAENYDSAACSLQPVDGLRVYPPGETASAYLPLEGFNGCDNDGLELLTIKSVGA